MSRNKISIIISAVLILAWTALFFLARDKENKELNASSELGQGRGIPSVSKALNRETALPKQKIIYNDYYIAQTFNNCAPAALSMALSYFGIRASQEELAESLRPFNNRAGINDDKSTPPEELAEKAREYGLVAYFRPNADIELIKALTAGGMPVVVRTLLTAEEDFAHYRVIKGYDDSTGEFIQDDSYQGKNLRYSYEEFLEILKPFNYGFLAIAKPGKKELVEEILGKNLDTKKAWQNAVLRAERELKVDPNDIFARFNLSVALYYTGDYKRSALEFEKAEPFLLKRMLWYQIEPIQSYFELGDYSRVFFLADKILNDNNKAFSELYLMKGKIYLAQGDKEKAREEFEKAVFYNKYYKSGQEALNSLD